MCACYLAVADDVDSLLEFIEGSSSSGKQKKGSGRVKSHDSAKSSVSIAPASAVPAPAPVSAEPTTPAPEGKKKRNRRKKKTTAVSAASAPGELQRHASATGSEHDHDDDCDDGCDDHSHSPEASGAVITSHAAPHLQRTPSTQSGGVTLGTGDLDSLFDEAQFEEDSELVRVSSWIACRLTRHHGADLQMCCVDAVSAQDMEVEEFRKRLMLS